MQNIPWFSVGMNAPVLCFLKPVAVKVPGNSASVPAPCPGAVPLLLPPTPAQRTPWPRKSDGETSPKYWQYLVFSARGWKARHSAWSLPCLSSWRIQTEGSDPIFTEVQEKVWWPSGDSSRPAARKALCAKHSPYSAPCAFPFAETITGAVLRYSTWESSRASMK